MRRNQKGNLKTESWEKWQWEYNIQSVAKAGLRGKFIAKRAHIKREDSKQIHLKKLEKEKQIKTKISRGEEIIKIRTEVNQVENGKPKGWIFEKIKSTNS